MSVSTVAGNSDSNDMAPTTTRPTHFRFLDLAPELRNNIYKYAFYHNRSERVVANTALLATCKKINKEAKELIFEEDNAFSMTIRIFKAAPLQPRASMSRFILRYQPNPDVNRLEIAGDFRASHSGLCPNTIFYKDWPARMLKFSRLHITIEPDFTDDGTGLNPSGCIAIRQVLYSLACFLQANDSPTIKSITFYHPPIRAVQGNTWRITQPQNLEAISSMPRHLNIYLSGLSLPSERVARFAYLRGLHPRIFMPLTNQFNAIGKYFELAPQVHYAIWKVKTQADRYSDEYKAADSSIRDEIWQMRAMFEDASTDSLECEERHELLLMLHTMDMYVQLVKQDVFPTLDDTHALFLTMQELRGNDPMDLRDETWQLGTVYDF